MPTTAGRDDRDPTAAPAGSTDPAGAASRVGAPSTSGGPPYLLLVGVVALLVPVAAAAGPLRDIDLYWHLRVGQEVLAGTPIAEAGRGWSFAPVPDTWISSQWLFEVLLARIEQIGGLAALALVRVVTAVAALAVLALVTLRRRPIRAGAWPFLLGALALTVVTQERSQQVTLVLAPLIGWWAERLWREGRLPRWWVVVPLVVVWANTHGGWVLLPVLLVLAAAARALDHGIRDRGARTGLLLAAVCVVAACMSPSGVANALAPLRFASSTTAILEWQPVTVRDLEAAPLLVMLLVVVVCWARGRVRPTRGELLLVVAVIGFGLVSARNLAPATLALAPVVTGTLARALGEPDPVPPGTRPPFARPALALGAVGAVLGVLMAPLQSPVVDPSVPQRLLGVLRDAPGDQRVLNGYNVSGPALWFAGPSPAVRVGIDGRADRYGAAYIGEYLDLVAARPGGERLLDELAPTSALLRDSDALTEVLVARRGWVEVGREAGWVLLRPPGATGWPVG